MHATIRNLLLASLVAGSAALAGCKEDNPTDAPKDTPKSALRVCHDCGTIEAIQPMKQKGDASGAGALLGAVAGAVVGHQFGGGRGKDVATVGGAVAGGFAGNEIERNRNATHWYHVTVAMNDGGTRTVDIAELAGMAVGSKVRVVGNSLEIASR
jgi:outer membrane lipoprotein SlyB